MSEHVLAKHAARFAVATLLAMAGCRDGGGGDGDDGGTGSGTADDDGSGGSTAGDDGDIDVIPPPAAFRRLLAYQYEASVTYLLGPNAADAAEPPVDQPLRGFDAVGARELPAPPAAVEQYERTSDVIADAAVADRTRLGDFAPCVLSDTSDACYEEVARDFGRVAWRRTLDDDEVSRLVNVATTGRAWGEGDFGAGLKYELMALLQSPSFLYMIENGEPDGDSRLLTAPELATRMSFFLLGRTPSRSLLDLAESGGLSTKDHVRQAAADLLEMPEARLAVRRFYDELYKLRELADVGKDLSLFPVWNEDLALAMRQETLLLVDNVVFEEEADAMEILTARYTFANDELAQVYGIAAPGGWSRVDIPDMQDRAGFLSQGGFLANFSLSDRNSPTKRGLFIQQKIRCETIDSPPPGVDTALPEDPGDSTLRELLDQHMSDPTCRACHGFMDPFGFALEGFNAVGGARASDNGQAIDKSGDVPNFGSFNGAREMADALASDPQVAACLVDSVLRHALGFVTTPDQSDGLDDLNTRFADAERNLKTLMVELAAHPLFRRVGEPE